ncbi:MAG: DUF433 domain-containing protein [Chloroflexota bacterium]
MVVLNIQHIVREDTKLGGKPHIAGTRMSVHQIAILHKSSDWSVERIADEFELTQAQIYAALAYYYDHQTQIDDETMDDDVKTKELGQPLTDISKSSK